MNLPLGPLKRQADLKQALGSTSQPVLGILNALGFSVAKQGAITASLGDLMQRITGAPLALDAANLGAWLVDYLVRKGKEDFAYNAERHREAPGLAATLNRYCQGTRLQGFLFERALEQAVASIAPRNSTGPRRSRGNTWMGEVG